LKSKVFSFLSGKKLIFFNYKIGQQKFVFSLLTTEDLSNNKSSYNLNQILQKQYV